MTLRPPNFPTTFQELIERFGREDDDQRAARLADRDREEREHYAETTRLRQIDIARKLSQLGPRFSTRTFETFCVPPGDATALAAALDVAEEPSTRGLWLKSDEKGNGKTHLAGAIVNDCIGRGIPATYLSLVPFVDRLKESYNRRGDVQAGQSDIITALASVPVLVLDDLDKPNPTPWFTDRMYRLVNDRYENNLPAIVTSNESPADVALAWKAAGGHRGEAVVDRLLEMCTLKVLVRGESYRGQS